MNWLSKKRAIVRLLRDEGGVAALEFAIAGPLVLVFAVGTIQLGMALFAQAGLRNAVENGARYATIYPTPSDSAISNRILSGAEGLDPAKITGPTIRHGTSNGQPYIDISMTYDFPMHFPFTDTQSINFRYGRRAYQY